MDKIEVCKRYELGWSCTALGVEFGVSRQRITYIVRKGRQYWIDHKGLKGRPKKYVSEEYLDELARHAREE